MRASMLPRRSSAASTVSCWRVTPASACRLHSSAPLCICSVQRSSVSVRVSVRVSTKNNGEQTNAEGWDEGAS